MGWLNTLIGDAESLAEKYIPGLAKATPVGAAQLGWSAGGKLGSIVFPSASTQLATMGPIDKVKYLVTHPLWKNAASNPKGAAVQTGNWTGDSSILLRRPGDPGYSAPPKDYHLNFGRPRRRRRSSSTSRRRSYHPSRRRSPRKHLAGRRRDGTFKRGYRETRRAARRIHRRRR